MYRGSIYCGRRGVAIQTISAIDIALWDIMGKFYGQPVCVLLGARWRDRVRAYASTLFRPTPEAMKEAARRYLDQGFTGPSSSRRFCIPKITRVTDKWRRRLSR
jgi:L-rhamnonate dehydratase